MILITLALILFSGTFAQEQNCKACEFGVKVFLGHLRSQRGVNFQIATLSRDVCPQMEDWFLCDYEVGKHWAGINHIIYQDSAAPYVCNAAFGSNCTTMEESFREWDCDSCIRDVVLMATTYSFPEVTRMFERYLAHEGFCEDPALGLNQGEIEACQGTIRVFIPPALRDLDAAYTANAQDICHYWYDGVCPKAH